MSSSQCFVPPFPPTRFDLTPAEIESSAKQICDTTKSLVDQLVHRNDSDNNFANTILPFIEAENNRLRKSRLLQFLKSTNPNQSLRDASIKASKLLADAELDLFMRADFYKAVSAVGEKGKQVDPEYQYYMEKLGEEFEQKGLGVSENTEALARFTAIGKRMISLQIEAFNNLNNDSSGLWFTIDDLQGLPPSFFENRRTNEVLIEPSTSERETKIWVSTKEADVLPILKLAKNSESRKRMFLARDNRCAENIPLYKEMFTLRDEAARLLGFEHHAAFRIHYKMAKTPDTVMKFLNNLEIHLKDHRNSEIDAMLKLKQTDTKAMAVADNLGRLFLWDRAFYDRILKENECVFDQKLVTEYFSLKRSLEVMLQTFEHLFGTRVQPYVAKPEEVWHEEVSVYTIWDADDQNGFLGWLYFDPYPRDGKYTHFGHYNLQPVRIMSKSLDKVLTLKLRATHLPRANVSIHQLYS
jgi:metallopeptidase MepB